MFQPLILFDAVFPEKSRNIAFVGMYRGPYFAAIELQARWVAAVFCGSVNEPSSTEKKIGIEKELKLREIKPRPQFPRPNYVYMCDETARRIGVYPANELKNSEMKEKLLQGPLIPAHFRLQGPGSCRNLAVSVINQTSSILL